MKKKHDRHLSSNKRDFEIAKKSQKGGPGTFWFDKCLSCLAGGRGLVGVGTIFGWDRTFSACHDKMQTNVF